jgi:hypothetical protein
MSVAGDRSAEFGPRFGSRTRDREPRRDRFGVSGHARWRVRQYPGLKLALVRYRIGAATAVLAITIIGCSGPPADQTDKAGPATTQAVGAPLVGSQRPEQPLVAPFQGLPPEGAPPSTPVTGELVLAMLASTPGTARTSMRMAG